MIELDSCPVCKSSDLVTLISTHTKYDDSFSSHNVVIINYILKNVLRKEDVLIHTKQCRQCKMIFLSPTFSPQELNTLYSEDSNIEMNKSHKQVEENTGMSFYKEISGDETLGEEYEKESMIFRRKYIYDVVNSFKSRPIEKMLDIGGGDGSNILAFEKTRKFVYDLVTPSDAHEQIEFINDLDIANSQAPFDLIVSTHALEHIINLKETMESYTKLVAPGSLFYVEVPAEYTRLYVKQLLYPVLKKRMLVRGFSTSWHVNYFSLASLKSLFAASGFDPLNLQIRLMPYGNLRFYVITGLFVYTGIPHKYYASNMKWYYDLLKSILIDTKTVAFRKLFNMYPALVPFK